MGWGLILSDWVDNPFNCLNYFFYNTFAGGAFFVYVYTPVCYCTFHTNDAL